MPIDFLIIGQGLAGSLLAWELTRRGASVLIIDNGTENASQIAAGLINPITGMRWVKSSDVDVLLPTAKRCYQQLAAFFRQDFYIEKPMLRVLRNDAEFRQAQKRRQDMAYHTYLDTPKPPDTNPHGLATPYGSVRQQQTGYLLTRLLLNRLKDFFIARHSYRTADFFPETIEFQPQLRWHDITPKQIIFCEGYQAIHNPWFSWLPFQAAKGEILTLAHQQNLPDTLLNYGNWLIPLTNKQSRIGATFSHEPLDTIPTAAARTELLGKLTAFSPDLAQADVIAQHANVRPCTLDKQPFLGLHPSHPQLAVFNGFGAKGSLQIPWYSQRFADTLLNNTPPPATIQRHYATHFPT
ncbi:MAG: FAD-binding oxidoreductase [Methylovulum sp.]|uniref:NAD(P)/FAD-dependent oxidoreductase n=1 Tax=Methylovulum sp. TaxID=1916980 RepID=UPI00261768EF|nr:FAD-binding oxidoreductase [Methylovulum sp.]MDD2725489.1 FAD-binding oxidoreductase [Methylovulum sp.]MDD5125141.1 FAD-binding oxidoreductase [Methylovulum sp.]